MVGQAGYCSQNLDLHFGLGNAAVVDSVTIEWLSGATEHYTGLSVNQLLTIEEGIPIGIQQNGTEVPDGFRLYQNFPNPFNPSTQIEFDVPSGVSSDNMKLVIYDITGKLCSELFNGILKPGSYSAEWNAANFPSGVYFYVFIGSSFKQTKKMILLK